MSLWLSGDSLYGDLEEHEDYEEYIATMQTKLNNSINSSNLDLISNCRKTRKPFSKQEAAEKQFIYTIQENKIETPWDVYLMNISVNIAKKMLTRKAIKKYSALSLTLPLFFGDRKTIIPYCEDLYKALKYLFTVTRYGKKSMTLKKLDILDAM